MDKYWNEDSGDRRQEIVVIGLKSEWMKRIFALNACLIKNYLEDPNSYHKIFPVCFRK